MAELEPAFGDGGGDLAESDTGGAHVAKHLLLVGVLDKIATLIAALADLVAERTAATETPATPMHMVALYTVWYNFIRIHKTLKTSPAIAAGVSATLWSMDDLVAMMDAVARKPGRRGPYKKRA